MDKYELYNKLLEISPNLKWFLKQKNVEEEFIECLYRYNGNTLRFENFIRDFHQNVITYSFEWADANSYLKSINKQVIYWSSLHNEFATNYNKYSIPIWTNIKLI